MLALDAFHGNAADVAAILQFCVVHTVSSCFDSFSCIIPRKTTKCNADIKNDGNSFGCFHRFLLDHLQQRFGERSSVTPKRSMAVSVCGRPLTTVLMPGLVESVTWTPRFCSVTCASVEYCPAG